MADYSFHLNLTQDIGHGVTLIFICAVAILIAVLIDLTTGVERAKKCRERIKSRILRRTISKVVDYYRLLFFGVLIDVLGLAFVWYNIPYCSVLISVGVVIVEGISVLENYRKMKSVAREVPAVVKQIIEAVTDKDAEKIIELIKENKGEIE
jgi:hypothetical protein